MYLSLYVEERIQVCGEESVHNFILALQLSKLILAPNLLTDSAPS